jgi:hypothetical protein
MIPALLVLAGPPEVVPRNSKLRAHRSVLETATRGPETTTGQVSEHLTRGGTPKE